MNNFRIVLLIGIIAITCGACEPPPEPTIEVGLGETIITPPDGTPLAGYPRTEPSEGVRHDLHARTLIVVDTEGTAVALMSLELFVLDRALMQQIRDGIVEQTGIPADNILISCTHTHSGPDIGEAAESYRTTVTEQAVASAVTAWNERAFGRIGTTVTKDYEVGTDSRQLAYGGLHPDPTVGVIRIDDAAGNLRGIAFFHGCDPSAYDQRNREITGDWPSFAVAGIKDHYGPDLWTAFFQGPDGDITVGFDEALDNAGIEIPVRGSWLAALKGNAMTWTVIEAAYRTETSDDIDIAIAVDYFKYPLKTKSALSRRQARRELAINQARYEDVAETHGGEADILALDRAQSGIMTAELLVEEANRVADNPNPQPLTVRQQAIKLGDTLILSLPSETFSGIGVAIRRRSTFEKTLFASMTDGIADPVPSEDAYKRMDFDAVWTRFDRKCAATCVAAAATLIERIGSQ
jgi:neutral ceramidase